MIHKKICMLGTFAVGKTSLVRRSVDSLFSDCYHTTIGVKVDKKIVALDNRDVSLVLWDVHGEDSFQKILPSYLRGMAGYVLVVDATRPSTVDTAIQLRNRVKAIADVPYVVALNKSDLVTDWDTLDSKIEQLVEDATSVVRTSAKTGDGVDKVFDILAETVTLRART